MESLESPSQSEDEDEITLQVVQKHRYLKEVVKMDPK